MKAEAADLLQRLQRSQADLINYRRRVERDSKELLIRVRANAVEQILPTLDDFTLAVKAVPPEHTDDEWIQGILLIERKLRGTLETWGLEKIEALGKDFDPWEHEVVLQEEADGVSPGQVIEVFRDGYKIEERSSGPPRSRWPLRTCVASPPYWNVRCCVLNSASARGRVYRHDGDCRYRGVLFGLAGLVPDTVGHTDRGVNESSRWPMVVSEFMRSVKRVSGSKAKNGLPS